MSSVGAGPDGVWGTADDDWDESQTFHYDGGGQLHLTLVHDAPGPDGVWGTADDVIHYGRVELPCTSGGSVTEIYVSGPGPDGVWGTADDTLLDQQRMVYSGSSCGTACVLPPIQ
jgi:hypothetical protein